jgi:4-amino-4-deoxy-L-arabinose transferase-like glycosyltransferase
VGLAIRVAYQLTAPATDPFRNIAVPGSDMETYLKWASAIAGGDLLHNGHAPFENSPLYPYLLAASLALSRGSPLDVGAWLNAVLGMLHIAIGFALARRWLSRGAALVAGLLMATAAPWIADETLLMPDTLVLVLYAAAWLLAVRWTERRTPGRAAVAALAISTTVIARPSFAIPALALLTFTFIADRRSSVSTTPPAGRRLACALSAALGLLLPLTAVAWLHKAAGGPFSPLPVTGAVNLYLGNAPDAVGTFYYPPSLEKLPTGAGSHLGRALIRAAAEQPVRVARLGLYKLRLTLDGGWPAQNVSMAVRLGESWLRGLPWTLWLAAALGWCGAIVAWRERRRLAWLYVFTVALVVSIAAVFVVGRLKSPLLLPLSIFAAHGLDLVHRWLRARRWAASAGYVLLVAALATMLPPNPRYDVRPLDVHNASVAWLAQNRPDKSEAVWNLTLRPFPGRADIRLARALDLYQQRRFDESKQLLLQRWDYSDQDDCTAFLLHAILEAHAGNSDAALQILSEGLRRHPNDGQLTELAQKIEASKKAPAPTQPTR